MGVVHRPAPSCALPDSILPCVMCSHHALLSRVMFPSPQDVSLVGQTAFFDNACEGCVRV